MVGLTKVNFGYLEKIPTIATQWKWSSTHYNGVGKGET